MTRDGAFRVAEKLAARAAFTDGHCAVACSCGTVVIGTDRNAVHHAAHGHLLTCH